MKISQQLRPWMDQVVAIRFCSNRRSGAADGSVGPGQENDS